jgi:hypothetical protein
MGFGKNREISERRAATEVNRFSANPEIRHATSSPGRKFMKIIRIDVRKTNSLMRMVRK